MKIILTDDVVGVGDIGENVEVRPGFARNFLIPRGLAIETGSKSGRVIAHKMRQIEAKKRRLKAGAEELAKKVRNITISLTLRVGSGGKVFGSIGKADIAAKIAESGHAIDRRRVLLNEPLKKPGTHFVRVRLHPEVEAQVKVIIEALEATQAQEEQETKDAREVIEAALGDEADNDTDDDTEE